MAVIRSCCGRVLKIYPSLQYFFLSKQDASTRFVLLENHFNNALFETYLLFYQSAFQVFMKFNLFPQRNDPLIARLYGSIQQFLRNLGCKFLTVAGLANRKTKEIKFLNPRYWLMVGCSR